MKRVVLFVAVFLLFLSFDSASLKPQEATGEIDEVFDLAVDKIYSISPVALKPEWSEVYKDGSFAATQSEAYITNSAGGPATLFTPVYLPDGATITEIAGLCKDNDGASPTNYVWMVLWRRDHITLTSEIVAHVSTEGLSPSLGRRLCKSSSISYPTVDNRYTYSLSVNFGLGGYELMFYGFWIRYEESTL
jgi:hypothetical protein